MFMTPGIAILVIAVKFFAGCIIGIAVAILVFRSKLRAGLAARGALFAGMAFLIMAGVSGWAGAHAEFINGHRQNVTSWGEHLWLRNQLSAYEMPLCIGSSIAAAALTSVFSRRTGSQE